MKLKCLTLTLLMLCLLAGTAMSATVGRITGVITDSQTKEPLVGVSVQIIGTTMGAMTNENGQYSILNVPTGTYTLRLTAVGFATVEISNVEVSADLATYQNETMSSQATDIGKTIQVTTERPLVVKDKTASIDVIRREEIQALPTRGFEQVVGIQTGVVKVNSNPVIRVRGGRESLNSAELNLRGGRPSEVAYYVDGFSQQDPLSGNSTANIANNAIKEVSVFSGGFPAEYGNVSSGIVNTITNSGTDVFHGNLEVVTDKVMKENWDQNWYSFDLSGPIKVIPRLYFFGAVERRYLGDRAPSAITEDIFNRFDIATQVADRPWRLPNNYLDGWSYQGKLDYSFTPNVKMALSGTGSRDIWREYRHDYLFDNRRTPIYNDKNLGLNAKLTHTLNANTFYNASLSYFVTERFRGDGWLGDDLLAYGRPAGNPRFDNTSLFWSYDREPVFDSSCNCYQFNNDEGSVWDDYLKRKSSYIGLKGDITSQVHPNHTIKAGFEFQRHTLRFYQHLFPTNVYQNRIVDSVIGVDTFAHSEWASNAFIDVNRYGYDEFGEESDDQGLDNETKHPINGALYLQDRFEWSGLIINAGLRFDYFDYKTNRFKNLNAPLDPDTLGDANASTLDEADLEPSEKFTRVSPRLGISFPVSDRTQLHLNYGKFFQRPDLIRLYVGYDFFEYKEKTGGYYFPVGNPNLQPEKTTQYEVGMTHQLGERTAFDITAYYKDVTDLVQVVTQPALPRSYSLFVNSDYSTIKGLEFEFRMRRTRNIEINLKYTLASASGTGSYAQSQSNIAWTVADPPKQSSPLDYDQRHNFVGIFDYRTGKGEGPAIGGAHPLENFGINILTQLGSGTPYSPQEIYNEVTLAALSPTPAGPINSQYGPWTFNIDLKAEKSFNFGNYKLSPYLIIKNLLDRDNVYAIYESTGRANTTGWLATGEGQEFVDRNADPDDTGLTGEEKYLLKEMNPQNYGNPRQFILGLRLSF